MLSFPLQQKSATLLANRRLHAPQTRKEQENSSILAELQYTLLLSRKNNHEQAVKVLDLFSNLSPTRKTSPHHLKDSGEKSYGSFNVSIGKINT